MRRGLIAVLFLAGCNAVIPTTSPGLTSAPTSTATSMPSPAASSVLGLSAGLPIVAAGTFTPSGIWAIVQNDLLLSEDGGATWWTATPNLPFDSSSNDARETLLDVLDAHHLWALTGDSLGTGVSGDMGVDKLILTVHRSTDGGRSWTAAKLSGSYPGTLQALHFVDADNGYLVITPGRFDTPESTILRTTDGGSTWAVVGTDGLLGTQISVIGRSIWAGSAGDAGPVPRRIFTVSHDAGKTWADVALPGLPHSEGQWATFPQAPTFIGQTGIALVSRTDGTGVADIYRSDDSGEHWHRVSTTTATSLAALSSSHWLRPGPLPGVIEATHDGGATWAPQPVSGMPSNQISWLSFSDAMHGAALALTGVDTLCNLDSGCLASAGLYLTKDGGSTWLRPGFWATAQGPAPIGSRGRIEIVNGPRPVIASIGTDLGSRKWLVPAGAHLVLLDEPLARPGGIEIIDADGSCDLLSVGFFDARPITIRLYGPASGPGYTLALVPGTSLNGPAVAGFYDGCSG